MLLLRRTASSTLHACCIRAARTRTRTRTCARGLVRHAAATGGDGGMLQQWCKRNRDPCRDTCRATTVTRTLFRLQRRHLSYSSSAPPPPPPPPAATVSIFSIRRVLVVGAISCAAFWYFFPRDAPATATSSCSPSDAKHGHYKFDSQQLYTSQSTKDLALSWLILKLCSYDFIVEYGPQLLEWAEKYSFSSNVARWILKRTFFKHFVAGETLEETHSTAMKLSKAGLGVVLDYSIEAGRGTTEELDKVAQDIVATIGIAARDPAHAFACLKVSGLTSFLLLERMSQIITYYNSNPDKMPLPLASGKDAVRFRYEPRLLPSAPTLGSPPPPLTSAEQKELSDLIRRLDFICRESYNSHVSVLFDAEQTYYQPAIDLLALYFCKKYNSQEPIVYNTYQMYIRDGPARLLNDILKAKRDGYILGVKLVRGAYLHTEQNRALQLHYADPIAPSIDLTHQNYEAGLDILFANLPNVSVMIASHNEHTVVQAMEQLKKLKVDPQSSRVQFAQLYGMGDHLSLSLVQNGFRVFKYVPFGPVEHVIPYLVRRMQENRGFIGSASETERQLIWCELMRRAGLGQNSTST